MKVQATVVRTFQAKSLAEAGAVLDDVLARARERDDVDVGRVEILSPPGDRAVTLPPVSPTRHRRRWRSSNLLERSLVEVKRRTKVIGRFPGETSGLTLVCGRA
jgi:transposase-like protein